MNFSKLNQISQEAANLKGRKPTIVLEKATRIKTNDKLDINIHIENEEWKLPDELKEFINELNESKKNNSEDKILAIYEKLCSDYMYDDNVLTYIKRVDEDQFELPDFYGKVTNEDWNKKRSEHNRRNCFELSRLLAKSLDEMLNTENNEEAYEVCILWDNALAHYYVGLMCDDYTLILDLDDFDKIKDLTRIKTNLTIEGIDIINDKEGKFQKALNKFNSNRTKSSSDHIDNLSSSKHDNNKDTENITIENEDIEYIKDTLEILLKDYDLDSSGIFEYMKEIIDLKFGPSIRKKVWKEVKTTEKGLGKRYTRCLLISLGKKQYIIDVTAKNVQEMFHPINLEKNQEYYKFLHRDWVNDKYDGR